MSYTGCLATSSLLAAGLGEPLLLWGFLLLAIPWLLHLLTKRQYRSTEWAAMRFLLEAMRKNSRRIRIEQLILLLVRTALLGLIVLGLARPLWTAAGPLLGGFEPVQRILVLDTSYSMGLEQGGTTLFARAQSLSRELVGKSRQGDAFQLVRLSQGGATTVISEPAYRKEDVLGELERMKVSSGGANLLTALESIAPLLERCPELSRKQVYIYTDLQKETWSSSGRGGERAAELLADLGKKTRLVIVDVGVLESTNLGVTSLGLSENLVTPNQEVEVRGTIRAFGPTGGSPVVELWTDGVLTAQQQVSVEGGEEATVVFPHRFSSGGIHRLRLKLPGDRLPDDDERVLAVDVKSEIRVLCVNGKPSGDERESAVYFLRLALAPEETPGGAKGLIQTHTIEGSELRSYDLRGYDAVFFCNVTTFDPSEATSIEQYLKSGGIVVWGMGDRVLADDYNRLFAQPGKMLLPAALAERQGDAVRKETVFNLSTEDLSHPMLKLFQGNPASGLGTAPVFEFYRSTNIAGEPPARKVLTLVNGEPLFLERSVGLGRSFLYLSSFDESWSSFAIWPSFLPFVQELVRYSVAANRPELSVEVYQSATIPNLTGERLQVRKPEGGIVSLGEAAGNTGPLVFGEVDRPGFYDVMSGSGELRHVLSATVPVEEGDLEKLTRAELGQGLLAGAEFDYQTETKIDSGGVGKPVVRTVEPARWLILAGLYLLFVELLMAWNFRAGMCLLFPPLIPFWLLRRTKSG